MKKFYSKLALLLVLVLTLASFFGVATFSATEIGDVNDDGKVTADDAIKLLYATVFDEDLLDEWDFDANGKVDSRDAIYLLYYSVWGDAFYPIPGKGDIGSENTGRVAITLVYNGETVVHKLVPGADLPVLQDQYDSDFVRYAFVGWFNEDKSEQFTVVPDAPATYYAVFEGTNTTDKIKLINGGNVDVTDLKVGDTLPVLSAITDGYVDDVSYEFDGWYSKDGTVKYTEVVEGVDAYFARFNNYTSYSFETSAIYDPSGKYAQNFSTTGIAAWERAVDPEGNNLTVKANLSNHGNTTHFALELFEGSSEGFKLNSNKKYLITFRYYAKSESVTSHGVSIRGSKQENIGTIGEKTGILVEGQTYSANSWNNGVIVLDTVADEGNNSSVNNEFDTKPYLIFCSAAIKGDLELYIDDLVIREFDGDVDVVAKTPAENVVFNNNGAISKYDLSYIGAELPAVTNKYTNAEFLGWYDKDLVQRYGNVPSNHAELYAKYSGVVVDFENVAPFDPNNRLGTSEFTPFNIVSDPKNGTNKVITANVKKNGSAYFALKSPYEELGYTLVNGQTYEISFKYLADNAGTTVSFHGCDEANIGVNNELSTAHGATLLETVGSWAYETVKFTYNADNPYLVMTALSMSDGNVYFDDIVISKVDPDVSYDAKEVTIGNTVLGATGQEINIVIPKYNFPYVATMQCEELDKALTSITGINVNLIKDNALTVKNNQFNIFVKNVGAIELGKDDYKYIYGDGEITVYGGSSWALAMAVSELTKELNALADGSVVAVDTEVSGNYNDKIGGYSTISYYRPTFVEDFDQEDIDTTIWDVSNNVEGDASNFIDKDGNTQKKGEHGWKFGRSAKHSYLEDGKFVINGAYDEDAKMFHGGMLRSHGQLEYLYGYLETSVITPNGGSLWSSVWLTPRDYSATGLYEPEVDVNECFGDATKSGFNMHAWPTSAGLNFGSTKYSFDDYTLKFVEDILQARSYRNAYSDNGKTLNDDFHTFGFLWTPDCAKFIFDGQVRLTYDFNDNPLGYVNHTTNLDAYNDYMSIIVSMTVGNNRSSDESVPNLSQSYWNESNKYIVDYVHVYQIDGQMMKKTPRNAVEIKR